MHRVVAIAFFAATPAVAETVAPLALESDTARIELTAGQMNAQLTESDGRSLVFVQLEGSGTEALAELTGSMIGEPLSILFCGQVITRPVVQEVIDSGSILFAMPSAPAAEIAVDVLMGEAECLTDAPEN